MVKVLLEENLGLQLESRVQSSERSLTLLYVPTATDERCELDSLNHSRGFHAYTLSAYRQNGRENGMLERKR
jgi:hypothetical protein